MTNHATVSVPLPTSPEAEHRAFTACASAIARELARTMQPSAKLIRARLALDAAHDEYIALVRAQAALIRENAPAAPADYFR